MSGFNFRKRAQSIQITEQTIKTPSSVKRVDTLEALAVELNEMEDYCLSRKGRSMSRITIKNWQSNIKAMFNRMSYLEYSRNYVRDIRRILEDEEERPPGTVYVYLMALQELFRANFDENYRIARPKVTVDYTDDANKYHTPEEIEKLLKGIKTNTIYGVRDLGALALLYFAALRNSELVHLTVNDYNTNDMFVIIRTHGQWHPKGYQTRKLNVPERCNDLIKTWLNLREKEGIGIKPESPLFYSGTGGAMQENTLRLMVRRRSADVGLKTFPHKLRHSRCSHLGNGTTGGKPWPVPTLCDFMGHSSMAVTYRYIHVKDADQKRWLATTKEIEI